MGQHRKAGLLQKTGQPTGDSGSDETVVFQPHTPGKGRFGALYALGLADKTLGFGLKKLSSLPQAPFHKRRPKSRIPVRGYSRGRSRKKQKELLRR